MDNIVPTVTQDFEVIGRQANTSDTKKRPMMGQIKQISSKDQMIDIDKSLKKMKSIQQKANMPAK